MRRTSTTLLERVGQMSFKMRFKAFATSDPQVAAADPLARCSGPF
jgi:hypothetical protein